MECVQRPVRPVGVPASRYRASRRDVGRMLASPIGSCCRGVAPGIRFRRIDLMGEQSGLGLLGLVKSNHVTCYVINVAPLGTSMLEERQMPHGH